MAGTLEIPIFPLKTVLFPAGRLPLRIFETRYVEMTKTCLRDDSVFGVALIRGGFETGRPAIPCAVGCTARIVEWEVPNPGLFTLMTQGESVFQLLDHHSRSDGLIVGRVALRALADPIPVPDRFAPMKTLLMRLIEEIGIEYFPQPLRDDDATWIGYRLAELLPVTPEKRQSLLEITEPLALLEQVERLLQELRSDA